jgi:hypothetical protein
LTTFAIAQIDELWIRGALAERRVMHGRAEERDGEIFAIDERDDDLVAECEHGIEALRAAMPADARVRLVARAERGGQPILPDPLAGAERSGPVFPPIPPPRNGRQCVSYTMTVEIGGASIVTTPEHAADDVQLLRSLDPRKGSSYVPRLPIVWRNGSAAVLLHEAIGHPTELGVRPIQWLHVDCPLAARRASFRDVPLRRMTRVVVTHDGGDVTLPEQRIDVHLVRGGAYDPLSDSVTIEIAVADAEGQRLAPFRFLRSRADIAFSLLGAAGPTLRYPGVVCSREGQELVVGSFAPVIVTREEPEWAE